MILTLCACGRRCFNPRTPCGVRQIINGDKPRTTKFQSTHSLRSATGSGILSLVLFAVSIHALLAECDIGIEIEGAGEGSFNPRTPCGVRQVRLDLQDDCLSFNPRTPCGVRHDSDIVRLWQAVFQSTHSLRSATNHQRGQAPDNKVSIHALLAECDKRKERNKTMITRFNPRTPCGVRPASLAPTTLTLQFQSTHSLRSATGTQPKKRNQNNVSIHALLAECDAS